MKINDPSVCREVETAVAAYEHALVENDLAALDSMFLQRDDTVRFGPEENLYGAAAIAAFRAARPPGRRPRDVMRLSITTFGADHAVANVEFRLAGDTRLGRQSQTWVRIEGRWLIAAAHVSYTSNAKAVSD